MTYQLTTFYCTRCRSATPHELSDDGQRAHCVPCQEQQRRIEYDRIEFSDTNRHIAALDGMGNRGEAPPRRRP